MNDFYLYVFIREDLSLPQQAVQACHASAEAGKRGYREEHGIANLVLLSVKNQIELFRARDYLAVHGISHEVFFEPDDNMGESSMCTHPVPLQQKKLFRRWPLWTGKS